MTSKTDFRRSAWFVPVLLLNVLFLGTSHVLSRLPIAYWALYEDLMAYLSRPFGGDIQSLYDFSSALLIIAMLILAYLAFRQSGAKEGVLRALQVGSVSLLPLGTEVFFFDHSEWTDSVTRFQIQYGIVPWFTNADLFALALVLTSLTTFLTIRWGEGERATEGSIF